MHGELTVALSNFGSVMQLQATFRLSRLEVAVRQRKPPALQRAAEIESTLSEVASSETVERIESKEFYPWSSLCA